MQLLSDLIVEYQEITKDTSAKNKTRGIRRMNEAYRRLCAGNYPWLEREFVITSVASQQAYDLPVDVVKISSVRYTEGGNDTILSEVVSPRVFDEINNQGTTVTSDYPVYWHQRDGELYLFPTPSSSSNNITVLAKRRPQKLELEDYTTGTISVTNASKTVTGSGTAWVTAGVKPGAWIVIDDIPYEIEVVGGETSLTLYKAYEGTTASGLSYEVGDAPIIPEEFQDLIWMEAGLMYDLKRKDSRLANIKAIYDEMKYNYDSYSKSTSTSSIIKRRRGRLLNPNHYPRDIT